jgi:glycine cleavage system H lipoate-binding protein
MILAFILGVGFFLVIGVWNLLLLHETGRQKNRNWRMGLHSVGGFLLHPDVYYHRGHSWIMPEKDGTVRIGLDDFGRKLIDGIREIALPEKGPSLREGKAAVKLSCGKKYADLLSPVNGVVTEVNASAAEGSAVARDPYGKGWLIKAKAYDKGYTALPTGANAMEWLKAEAGRLATFLNKELGMTAADGGELIAKPAATLSDEQWKSLVTAFFHGAKVRNDGPNSEEAE